MGKNFVQRHEVQSLQFLELYSSGLSRSE